MVCITMHLQADCGKNQDASIHINLDNKCIIS